MRCTLASIVLRLSVASAALMLASPDLAQACSCLPPGTPQHELAQPHTSSVFLGRVQQIAPRGSTSELHVTFARSRVWKGPLDPLLTTTTAENSALCGVHFVVGQEYLVYEHSGGRVTLCSRTSSAAAAGADLAALGPGAAPQAASVDELTRHAQLAGSWFNPARSGEGFVIETLDAQRGVVYWFGYDEALPERQAWMTGVGTFDGSVLEVELLRPVGGGFGDSYRADQVSRPVWGSLRLELRPDGTGQAAFTSRQAGPGASPVTFSILRLTRPPASPAREP